VRTKDTLDADGYAEHLLSAALAVAFCMARESRNPTRREIGYDLAFLPRLGPSPMAGHSLKRIARLVQRPWLLPGPSGLIFRRYLELSGVNALVRDLKERNIHTKTRLLATGGTRGGILRLVSAMARGRRWDAGLERDFFRRRQAPQKRPRDDISAQRLEIGDHRAREMAANICSPESDGSSESHLKRGIQPVQPASFQIDPIHAVMEVVSEAKAGCRPRP
jgi:hypothetical protein